MVCVLCSYPGRTYIKLQSKKRPEYNFPQLIQKYGGIEIVKCAYGSICKKCYMLLTGLHKRATQFYKLCQEARKRIYDTDEPVQGIVSIVPPTSTPTSKKQVSFNVPLTDTEMPLAKKARLEHNNNHSLASNPSVASSPSVARTIVVHKVISSKPVSTTAAHTPWINRTLGSDHAIRMSSDAVVIASVDKDKRSPLVAKVLVSKPNPGNSAARGVPLVAKVVGIAKLDAPEEETESAKTVKTSSIGPPTSTSSTPRYGAGALIPHANYHNTTVHHSKPLTSKSIEKTENTEVLLSEPKPTILAVQTTVSVSPNPKAAQNTTSVYGPLIARAKSLADRYYAPPQITVKDYKQIISTLQAGGHADLLADVLLGSSTLRQSITRKLVKEAERNSDKLSSRRAMSMLRNRDKGLAAAIKDFSWGSVVNENLQTFPTLIDMMLGISLGKDGMKDAKKVEKITPRIGFVMAILLQNRHLEFGLVQQMNTIILYHSNIEARFAWLQKLGICLSLKARSKLAEELDAQTVDK